MFPFFPQEFFARRVNTEMADRRQHDAQEFQLYLLDALHEDTNRVSFAILCSIFHPTPSPFSGQQATIV